MKLTATASNGSKSKKKVVRNLTYDEAIELMKASIKDEIQKFRKSYGWGLEDISEIDPNHTKLTLTPVVALFSTITIDYTITA